MVISFLNYRRRIIIEQIALSFHWALIVSRDYETSRSLFIRKYQANIKFHMNDGAEERLPVQHNQ